MISAAMRNKATLSDAGLGAIRSAARCLKIPHIHDGDDLAGTHNVAFIDAQLRNSPGKFLSISISSASMRPLLQAMPAGTWSRTWFHQ